MARTKAPAKPAGTAAPGARKPADVPGRADAPKRGARRASGAGEAENGPEPIAGVSVPQDSAGAEGTRVVSAGAGDTTLNSAALGNTALDTTDPDITAPDVKVPDIKVPDITALTVTPLDVTGSDSAEELQLAPFTADALPVGDDLVPDIMPDTPPERRLPAPADPLARYIQEVRRFPELDRDEELRLARLYRDTHDAAAARRIVTAHLMLVVKLALMYRRAIRNVMDLIQEGNIGLLEALRRYDPEQGVRFPTYAAWWIKAYMLKFLLDNARLVRVGTTNARRKLLYNLRRERERLERQGVAVTAKLLAEHFEVPEHDVVEVERAMRGGDVSVDAPITDDGSITLGDTLHAPIPSAEDVVSADEIRERVTAALAEFRTGLGEREQAILDARLVAEEPQTLQELGDRFGVTREAMRQAENKLKERLGRFLRDRLGDEVVLQFGR